MKIIGVMKNTVHVIETDGKDCSRYTRWGPDSWTVSMGESEEHVYDCTALESAFQEFIHLNTNIGGERIE